MSQPPTAMQNRRNYYRVLHVQPDAPAEIIRTSYRTLMQRLRMHPDLGGDHWNAALINEAFETLSDPVKRATYDLAVRQAGIGGRAAAPSGAGPSEASDASLSVLPGQAPSVYACAFCGTPHAARDAANPNASCASCGSPLFPAVHLQNEDASRRALERVPRLMAVQYCLTWPALREFSGATQDLSIAGMRFTTDLELVPQERLRMDCEFCSAVAIVRSAHQHHRHTRLEWAVGVEFLTLRIKQTRGSLIATKA